LDGSRPLDQPGPTTFRPSVLQDCVSVHRCGQINRDQPHHERPAWIMEAEVKDAAEQGGGRAGQDNGPETSSRPLANTKSGTKTSSCDRWLLPGWQSGRNDRRPCSPRNFGRDWSSISRCTEPESPRRRAPLGRLRTHPTVRCFRRFGFGLAGCGCRWTNWRCWRPVKETDRTMLVVSGRGHLLVRGSCRDQKKGAQARLFSRPFVRLTSIADASSLGILTMKFGNRAS